jgi:phosphoglycolate phosphatase-like HAD superfamily hydrolase
MSTFAPRTRILIGIDSDGCAFDVMDLKHDACFCPAFIEHYGLQAAARAAWRAWRFVNLDGRSRGTNRFAAIPPVLDLLRADSAVAARGCVLPADDDLRAWLAATSALGEPALAAAAPGRPQLERALAWSLDVNARIARVVHGVPPLPGVREAIAAARSQADCCVISAANAAAIAREWGGSGLLGLMDAAYGQETGSKTAQLRAAIAAGAYDPRRVLMIGDAPGDLASARAVGARFAPVVPGDEIASWTTLREEIIPAFLADGWTAAAEAERITVFLDGLPERPEPSRRS